MVCGETFWHFLFNCPYALCSSVYLAVLLLCSTGSKGHVNHVINSVHAFRHSTMCLSPLNLGDAYNVKEIGVSWCQILMRRHMEIAGTLYGEERAGNTHLSTWEGEIQESESCKSRSGETLGDFNLMSEHQRGLDSRNKPMKNCKTQILCEGLFRKTTMLGSHCYIAW